MDTDGWGDYESKWEAYERRRKAALDALWYGMVDRDKEAIRRADDATYGHPNRVVEPGTGVIHAAQTNRRLSCTRTEPSRLHQRLSPDAPVGCPQCRANLNMPPMAAQRPMNVASHNSLNQAALYIWYLLEARAARQRQARATKALNLLDTPMNVQAALLPALEAIAEMNEDTA